MDRLTELGFYTLAGHSDSPRDAVHEARAGEELGLGSAFISERFNVKDACTLSGAVGAVTESSTRAPRGSRTGLAESAAPKAVGKAAASRVSDSMRASSDPWTPTLAPLRSLGRRIVRPAPAPLIVMAGRS